jgi:serine/threonine-protein kinase
VVFKAWDAHLRRHVALKFLTVGSDQATPRFLREAQAQARVDHPGICTVYEVGEAAGHRFIAMQLIDGSPLGALVHDLSLEQKALVVAEVAEAVHAAHRLGLIHRDLKPANIMVERGEDGRLRPYVVDFGMVRDTVGDALTVDGVLVGTPSFMAPEQASGEISRVDRRADVYSLGATLYAIVAGTPPFAGGTPIDVVLRVLDEEPTPLRQLDPTVPVELESIVLKCLEKDRERRYDSARALAEDLHRFLDGVPVRARPSGVAHRLAKWVRRNRSLAAVVLVAVTAVGGLGGAAVHTRWSAARQAALAQRLGEEVKEIESLMRFAHLLPLHDTGPERRVVEERIAALEARLSDLGRSGQGPASAALGRAALAAGDLAAARTHLERAWSGGYREPEVAYALGLTLARAYQRESQAAERIASREARELRGREIDAELRERARRLLAASAGARVDAPEYLEALLARLDGRYPEALERAAAAAARLPWLYEAHALAAEVHVALGRAAVDAGRPDVAADALDRAIASAEEAARIGASDGEVLAALAECRLERMKLEESLGSQPAALFEATLAAAAAAAEASPDSARPYVVKALAWVARATFLASRSGEDPTPLYERAVELADAALARSPGDGEAYRVKGAAWADLATYLTDHGRDPRPSLDRAIAALERALQVNPRDVNVHNHLGISHWNLGAHQARLGVDPLPAYQRAAESFRKALDVYPELFVALGNLAGVQLSIADALEAAGSDPRPVLREAIASYARVIPLRPGHPLPYSNLSIAHIALGRFELTHGGDPGDAFEAAVGLCRKAHEVDPSYVLAYENLASARLWTARQRMARGEDARSEIDQAVAELEAGLRIRPSHPEPLGAALILLADNELAAGRDPDAALARAARTLDDAVRLAPDDPSPLVTRATVDLVSARARLARGASPAAQLAGVRAFAGRAAAMRGGDAEIRALLATAFRVEAEAAASPAARARAVAAGLAELAAVAPPDRDSVVRAAEAALRVVGAEGTELAAACTDLLAALTENPTLRPRLETVSGRCR